VGNLLATKQVIQVKLEVRSVVRLPDIAIGAAFRLVLSLVVNTSDSDVHHAILEIVRSDMQLHNTEIRNIQAQPN
jgi:hypothetical protein